MDHGVVHFEIPADDPDKLAEFYTALFGWKIEKYPMDGMDYWGVTTVPVDDNQMPTQPGAINGGLTRKMMPSQVVTNYVQVESVSDFVEKAKGLGATVVIDKTPIPNMGAFALVMDPQGNPCGLFESAPQG